MKLNWQKTRNNFRGRFCTAGMDLSSVDDLTCAVFMFPYEEDREKVDVLMRTWCCRDKIYDRKNKYRDQYQGWEREGWIHVTDGNAIDYDLIRKEVVEETLRITPRNRRSEPEIAHVRLNRGLAIDGLATQRLVYVGRNGTQGATITRYRVR